MEEGGGGRNSPAPPKGTGGMKEAALALFSRISGDDHELDVEELQRWLSRGWIEKKKRMESDGWIGRNVAGRASSHSAPLVEGRNNETAAADGAAVPATKNEASRDLRDPPAAAAAGDPPASGKTKSVTAAALAAAAAWGWKAPTSTTKEDPTSLSSTAFISNEPEVAAETAVKAPREVQEQGPRRKAMVRRRERLPLSVGWKPPCPPVVPQTHCWWYIKQTHTMSLSMRRLNTTSSWLDTTSSEPPLSPKSMACVERLSTHIPRNVRPQSAGFLPSMLDPGPRPSMLQRSSPSLRQPLEPTSPPQPSATSHATSQATLPMYATSPSLRKSPSAPSMGLSPPAAGRMHLCRPLSPGPTPPLADVARGEMETQTLRHLSMPEEDQLPLEWVIIPSPHSASDPLVLCLGCLDCPCACGKLQFGKQAHASRPSSSPDKLTDRRGLPAGSHGGVTAMRGPLDLRRFRRDLRQHMRLYPTARAG